MSSGNFNGRDDMSHRSTNHGSIQERRNISQHRVPFQVDTSHGNNNEGGDAATMAMDFPPSEKTEREALTSTSDKFIADKVKEMSQVDSPQVRELASKLGNMLNIESPRYQPDSSESTSYLQIDISGRWQILQGCNGWNGLLDPFDRELKAEIIRYGEFAQATYDAFDHGENASNLANPQYDKESLLESVGLVNRGYELTNFIYGATNHAPNLSTMRSSFSSSRSGSNRSSSKQSNWIGFVAVCTSADEIRRLGRRDIVIAWRGTVTANEWLANITDYMSPVAFGPEDDCSKIMVEAGFYNLYTSKNPRSRHNKDRSARDQVMDAIKALVEKYKEESNLSITVTGHSLGSVLAILCAYDIAQSKFNLLSDVPNDPQRWSSEWSRPGAKSNDDKHVQNSHFESVRNFVHSVAHHDVDDNTPQHTPTTSVTNFLHSKLHHRTADGDGSKYRSLRIFKGVKDLCGNDEEAEFNEFPKGRIPITVYSFAGPRVGNRNFRDRIQELGVAVLRVVNVRDLVTKIPGLKNIAHLAETLHKIIPHLPSYKHVGVKLEVDNEKSVFLKPFASITQAHSLEAYLHLVDVYRGKNKPYAGAHKKTFRHYALVNKHSDFLRPEFSRAVPPYWWSSGSKVERDKNGEWRLPEGTDGTGPKPTNAATEYADFWKAVDEAAAKSKPAMSSF